MKNKVRKRGRKGGRDLGYTGKYCSKDLKCDFVLQAQTLVIQNSTL